MNSRFLLYGILTVLIWNTENASSVLLTSTLMTGLMGGFLLGRMSLGTFLGLLSNNVTGLPSLPSVNLSSILPSFSALIPQEEEHIQDDVKVSIVNPVSPSAPTSPPVIPSMFVPYTQAQPNIPQVYTYSYPMYPSYAYPTATTTTTTEPTFKLSVFPIRPIDMPISLDNRVRDRFIRQLAIMDPLNCLPKIFCEVSADPMGATLITNHGTIANVGSMDHSTISKDEMVAYEYHLQRKRTTTTTPKPTTTTTTTTATPQNDEDQSASEEDDISGSSESEEDDDDSFEQYRKEHEHKIEMQALEEMVDDIEDPQTYMYVLRDKQRQKEARKKYKEKQKNKGFEASSGGALERQDDFLHHAEADHADISPTYGNSDYNEELFSPHLNRRISVEPPRHQPPPPMQPPMFISPMMPSTEAPLHDMFAGDPFFDDFSSRRSARSFRENLKTGKRRVKRQSEQKEDLMSKYRVAYMVAEKYRSPDMCNVAFPSCPYRAKTILSVVSRLESGFLPFQLASDKKNYFTSKNNIHQFKNTLQAIERLNKATLLAQARGEPINVDELAEAAVSPSSGFDASTSQSIVNEFQQVAAKIKTAKMKKRKKHRRKKDPNNQSKYDAVHYYKKAQMETLKPKLRIKPGVLHTKERVKQQDDELQTRQQWGDVPSFKQTYKEMFKVSKGRKERPKSTTTTSRPTTTNKSKPKSAERRTVMDRYKLKTTTIKPVIKFSENDEDDEKDARQSEEAISRLIAPE